MASPAGCGWSSTFQKHLPVTSALKVLKIGCSMDSIDMVSTSKGLKIICKKDETAKR